MNIIEKQLVEWDKWHGSDTRADRDFLRQSMFLAMEEFAKEAVLEKDKTDNSWNSCVVKQIDRHTEILNKYKSV
jgi:hypothetical protein